MCDRVIQFCNGSTKPLLLAGSTMKICLAAGFAYFACRTRAIFTGIDAAGADRFLLDYYLQLAAFGYLLLLALVAALAALKDHKLLIRALAIITMINSALVIVAIFMNPAASAYTDAFKEVLERNQNAYDYADKPAANGPAEAQFALNLPAKIVIPSNSSVPDEPRTMNATAPRATRMAPEEVDKKGATQMWDRLQERGCCGTAADPPRGWPSGLPKTCCSKPTESDSKYTCKEADAEHSASCLQLIGETSMHSMALLALLALLNLYVGVVAGVSAFRTFHYSETSQSAYT